MKRHAKLFVGARKVKGTKKPVPLENEPDVKRKKVAKLAVYSPVVKPLATPELNNQPQEPLVAN